MANRKPFSVIDCETNPFEKGVSDIKPFIWGYYNGIDYFNCESIDDLLLFLKDRKETVYAHNGGKFDFHFFIDRIPAFTDMLIINGRYAKFNINKVDFRDSYCILPIALREFKKDEFDYSKMSVHNRKQYMPEIKKYLKNDCVNLWDIINDFVKEYGKGITLAGTALKKCAKIEEFQPPKTTKHFHDYFKPFYYGGRCQAFQKGLINEPSTLIDINSAYPYAMTFNHPFSEVFIERSIKVPQNPETIIPSNFYRFSGTSQGGLPFRTKKHGLAFPSDKKQVYEFNVTGWELQTALQTSSVQIKGRQITEYHFPETRNFEKYVQHFYTLKNQNKKGTPNYIFAKLMLNSCYGKFGANPDNYHAYQIIPMELVDYYCDNFNFIFERDLCNEKAIVKRPLAENEKRYYNVTTAASITGFVRAYLFRAIHTIIHGGGRVFYSDTDSIIYEGSNKGITLGNDIGQWDIEGKFKSGGIAGKKLYAFQTNDGKYKIASKGAKLTAKQILYLAADPSHTIDYTFEAPVFSVKKEPYTLTRTLRMS